VHVNVAGGELWGTLRSPDECGPHPLALILPGSGPIDHEGNASGLHTSAYALLAEAFADAGIASVRYDKRGVGRSGAALDGDGSTFAFEDDVADARAWAEAYADDGRFSSLVLVGHSEGALWALLLAQQVRVAGVISLEGSGRPVAQVLHDQLTAQLAGSDDELLMQAEAIVDQLAAGERVRDVPTQLEPLFGSALQTYLMSWMKYDPAAEIAKLDVPALIVQGTTDLQVSVRDAQLLADAGSATELLVIEGMCHVLKDAPDDRADQLQHAYQDPTLPLDRELVRGTSEFIAGLAPDE
jgi:alpha-beta hydrolase superfamily lysophospholipase